MNTFLYRHRAALSKSLLILATLIWGSSFFIMKNTIEQVPIFWLLKVRFFTAAAVLLPLALARRAGINRAALGGGALMGLLLFASYVAQTWGLAQTTPGKSAFLTTVYCILVPFVYWAVQRVRPGGYHVLACVLCMAGIGLASLGAGLRMERGDALTLLGGLLFALHIVAISLATRKSDAFVLTVVQFAVAGALSLAAGLIWEREPVALPPQAILPLAYLCLVVTAGALMAQVVGQKYVEPATAGLIFSLEAVFGILFSVIFYAERPTPRTIVGFVLIFCALVISETRLGFLRRGKRRAVDARPHTLYDTDNRAQTR